jgi:hypothetical protein
MRESDVDEGEIRTEVESTEVFKMERLPGFNVANVFEKRALLTAINCLAGLSIFFFGYDQGSALYFSHSLYLQHEELTKVCSRCDGRC